MLKPLKRGTPVLQVRQGSITGQILAMKEVDEFTLNTVGMQTLMVDDETCYAGALIVMQPFIPNLFVNGAMFAHSASFDEDGAREHGTNSNDFLQRFDPFTNEIVGEYRFQVCIPPEEVNFCMSVTFSQENIQIVPVGQAGAINGQKCSVEVDRITFVLCDSGAGSAEISKEMKIDSVFTGYITDPATKTKKHTAKHPIVIGTVTGNDRFTALNPPSITIQKKEVLCPDPTGAHTPKIPAQSSPHTVSVNKPPAGKYALKINETIFIERIVIVLNHQGVEVDFLRNPPAVLTTKIANPQTLTEGVATYNGDGSFTGTFTDSRSPGETFTGQYTYSITADPGLLPGVVIDQTPSALNPPQCANCKKSLIVKHVGCGPEARYGAVLDPNTIKMNDFPTPAAYTAAWAALTAARARLRRSRLFCPGPPHSHLHSP
jgi:hypothetical protein